MGAAEIRIMAMGRLEAEQKTDRIKQNFNENRRLIKEMRDRDGWESLEYSSFDHWAREELRDSYGHVYRLLRAAEVETHINDNFCPGGQKQTFMEIPEKQLRPLAPLLKQPDAHEKIRDAWDIANDRTGGKPTEAALKEAVDVVLGKALPGQTSFLDDEEDLERWTPVPAEQVENDLSEQGARAWTKILGDYCLIKRSLEKLGDDDFKKGVRFLVRKWRRERIEEAAEFTDEGVEFLQEMGIILRECLDEGS